MVRNVARVCLSGGYFAQGDSERCVQVLYEGLKEDRDPDQGNPTLLLQALSCVHWMLADPARMAQRQTAS